MLCTQDGIYLRESPGVDGKVIALLNKGNKVFLSGEAENVDGLTWIRVLQSPHGEGWIAQKYIQ